jgi:hypothetical protein
MVRRFNWKNMAMVGGQHLGTCGVENLLAVYLCVYVLSWVDAKSVFLCPLKDSVTNWLLPR